MAQELRQSTQVKVVIGPVVAVGDGFTPVTSLTLSGADEAELMKHDASAVVDISGATIAAITSADGYYNVTLTTSHTDTLGMLTLLINDDSLCLPVKATFVVIDEYEWDRKYTAVSPGLSGVVAYGTAQSATSTTLVLAAASAFADDELNGCTALITGGTGAGQIRKITDYVSSSDTATVDTWTTTPSGTITYVIFGKTAPLATGELKSTTGASNWLTNGQIAAGAIGAAQVAADTITASKLASDVGAEIADAVLDEALSGHTTAGTLGKALADIEVDTSTTLQAELDGIQADTEDIQSRLPAALVNSRMDATVDATGMETGAIDAMMQRALTEAYSTDGGSVTVSQALYEILAFLSEFSVSGTTLTVKKRDGTTTAFTCTLSDASDPTSITRAT